MKAVFAYPDDDHAGVTVVEFEDEWGVLQVKLNHAQLNRLSILLNYELREHNHHSHSHHTPHGLKVPITVEPCIEERIPPAMAYPAIAVSISSKGVVTLGPGIGEGDASGKVITNPDGTPHLAGALSATNSDSTLLSVTDNGNGSFNVAALGLAAGGKASVIVSDTVESQEFDFTVAAVPPPPPPVPAGLVVPETVVTP